MAPQKLFEQMAKEDLDAFIMAEMTRADLNKDGKLSFEQFNLWVTQNPDLADWFNHQRHPGCLGQSAETGL